MHRTDLFVAGLLGLALFAVPAAATSKMIARPRVVSAPAGGGQQALSVGLSGNTLRAAACASLPCALDAGLVIPVPDRLRDRLFGISFEGPLALDGQRQVILARLEGDAGERWVSVVAAPLSGTTPLVLFNDLAEVQHGLTEALPQNPQLSVVQLAETGGRTQLVVGARRDDIGTCGARVALLSPRVLDTTTLELKPARVPRFSVDEERTASKLTATRRTKERKAPLGRLLTATGASSSKNGATPASLVDGDPDTWWSEGKGSDGRGEFVTLRVPVDVPLTDVSFVVRPKTKAVEDGAAPKRLWLATDGALLEITLPDDAWQNAGGAYDVHLPEPLATTCLAVVLEDAAGKPVPHPVVTLAEVEARTAFDAEMDLPSLAGALAGGDKRARAAAAVLMRGGAEARRAARDAYSSLDELGRVLALDVMDQGPCEESAPVYVEALSGSFEGEVVHGRTRIERCRKGAMPALLASVADVKSRSRLLAAQELALVAPEESIDPLSQALTGADPKSKRELRRALRTAASSPKSAPGFGKALSDTSRDPAVVLELLRAAEDRLADASVRSAASASLQRVAPATASADLRYLALSPASALARAGDAPAASLLQASLSDVDAHLRARGARLSGRLPALRPQLVALQRDAEPRVREAVALALSEVDDPQGRAALVALTADEWTFVRSDAYDGLAAAPADATVDQALVARLPKDRSAVAAPHLMDAIAQRNIASAGPALRKLGEDEEKPIDVRARAVQALGGVCDQGSVDYLTKLARDGASATALADQQTLAGSAIVALGRLHPADLASRLAPLRGEGIARAAAEAAKSALEERDVCPR